MYVYGALDASGVVPNAVNLIFEDKTVKGYWLSNELKLKSTFTLMGYFGYV